MTAWKNIWNKIESFGRSEWFLLAVSVFAVFFWAMKWVLAAAVVLAGLCALLLVLFRDGRPALAVVALFTMSLGDLEQIRSRAFFVAAAVMLPLVAASVLYRFVRCAAGRDFTLGNLFWGMAVAAVVSTLGGIGYADFTARNVGIVFGMCLAGFCFYLLFVNTIKERFVRYCAKLVMAAGLVVLTEILILYLRVPGAINDKSLVVLGWGVSNNIAGVLAMAIPLTLYLAIDSKRNYLYIIVALLLYGGIFLTFSRGNILFASLLLLPMLAYVFCRTRYKFGVLIPVILACIALLVCFIAKFGAVKIILEEILRKGLESSGREEIYKLAIREFFKWPIFGVGVFGDKWNDGTAYNMYHCTVLQILVNFGIVGLLGYALFFYQRYAAFFRRPSAFKVMAVCAVLLNELYGLMDINFYILYQTFFVLILCIAAEKETEEERQPVWMKRENTMQKVLTSAA